jgi:hypothetical protein
MLGRSSRRSIVLLVVAVAAMVVTSCGGGGGETTSTSGAVVVTTLPSGGAGGENPLIGTAIAPTVDTPSAFVDVYQTQPVVVLFYVSGGADDVRVLENLQQLQPSFGAYTFFSYEYSDSEKYGDLSTLLAVDYPPMMFLFDRTGIIRQVWSGYVDQGSLNQSLVNLGRD